MLKKFGSVLLLSLCIGLLMAGCAKDEEVLTGIINGFVSDYTNANSPIAGATVTINSKGLTKTTGSDGRFEFANLDPGTYSIAVSANNYQTTTKQITVYAGQTANCDFQLEKAGASIEISPENLAFGAGVEQLSFNIKNKGNQSLTYSISNAPDFIEVSPASGTVAAKGTQAVSVHVKNRSSITTNRTGQLTVNVGNDSYIVSINVANSTSTDPNNEDPNQPSGEVAVSRGLLAYYTFDGGNANNTYKDTYHGVTNGDASFVTNTPNGNGKAISLNQNQFINIPYNILNEKTAFTISLWLKDFGTGYIFKTPDNYYVDGSPTLYINDNNTLKIYYGGWGYGNTNLTLQSYQSSGWHMLTVIFDGSTGNILIYIDGKRFDSIGASAGWVYSRGEKMQIGGSDPMITDNVRIHSVALKDDEVLEIYNSEK